MSVETLCQVLPCSAGGGGAAGLSAYVFDRIVTAAEVAIIAAAALSLFVAAGQMAMFSDEEGTVKEARTSYIYIITGLAITGLARWFSLAFAPSNTGSDLVNAGFVEAGIGNVVVYFRMIIAITLVVNIVLQAFRLITSQGQQEQTDKAKKRLIAGFIGAGIIMMANAIVESALPGYGTSNIATAEVVGLANYLLTIVGFLALMAIIVAGVMLIVSVDESLKEKAKLVVKTAIVALIMVLVSFALVSAFIFV